MGGLPTSTVNGVAVHPGNPKAMYVGTREGIFRTETAGESWTRATNGPRNVAAVAVNPKKPSEVYAVTADGKLYRSADEGRQWGQQY